MRYTRKEIDKTGKMMLTATNQETFKEAIEKLNDWRSLHLVPLDMLQQRLLDFLDTNNIHPLLVSRRLKRLTSIQYKLDLNPEMGLGGMQDIGGLRVVVNTVEELLRLHALLRSLPIADFECRRMYDYVNVPKETGYRSIHFSYIYHCDNHDYDKYSLRFSYYILPIVLKQHFIFCLLWLYTHYIIDRQISYSILHLHLLSIG